VRGKIREVVAVSRESADSSVSTTCGEDPFEGRIEAVEEVVPRPAVSVRLHRDPARARDLVDHRVGTIVHLEAGEGSDHLPEDALCAQVGAIARLIAL